MAVLITSTYLSHVVYNYVAVVGRDVMLVIALAATDEGICAVEQTGTQTPS